MVNTLSSVLQGLVEVLPQESVSVPLFARYQHRARNSDFLLKMSICLFQCSPRQFVTALIFNVHETM